MRLRGNSSFFRKSFMITLLLACLPTAFIGVTVYIVGTKQVEHEVNRSNELLQHQAYIRIDDKLSRLETALSQWAFNPNFDETLRTLDLRDQYRQTYVLFGTLLQMKSSDSLVKDVILYLQNQDVLITDNLGVLPVKDDRERADYNSLLKRKETIFWTKTVPDASGKTAGYAPISLVIRIPGGSVDSFGAIIVYLSDKELNQLIAERSSPDGGASMLMMDDGTVLSTGQTEGQAGSSQAGAFERFLSGDIMRSVPARASDNRIVTWDRAKYSVTYDTMDRINVNWVYVTASPLDALTKPVKWMARLTVGVSLSVLAGAILLSWIASRRIAQPVRQLMNKLELPARDGDDSGGGLDEFAYIAEKWSNVTRESQQLQTKLDRQLPSLREGFLLQWMQGHFNWMQEAELRARMEQFGWELDSRRFGFLLVHLHGLGRPHSRFSSKDEQLATFAAANVAQELLKESGVYADVVNFQDLNIGIVVYLPGEQAPEACKADMYRMGERIGDMLHAVLRLQQTIVVGRPTDAVRAIARIAEETRLALRYSDATDVNQILDIEDLVPVRQDEMYYPFEAEEKVIWALKMAKRDEAVEAVHAFVTDLQHRGVTKLQLVRVGSQLLGNMLNAMMQAGSDPYNVIQGDNLYEELAAVGGIAELGDWLVQRIVYPYVRELELTQNLQVKRMVEQAVAMLHKEFARDLSLEECAERLGTYPQKLSIGFKQVTGENFIDYLTMLRMEKAKELLLHTEQKVNDIAEQVGYQPSYFNRLFKRHEGVTPGQYREAKRAGTPRS